MRELYTSCFEGASLRAGRAFVHRAGEDLRAQMFAVSPLWASIPDAFRRLCLRGYWSGAVILPASAGSPRVFRARGVTDCKREQRFAHRPMPPRGYCNCDINGNGAAPEEPCDARAGEGRAKVSAAFVAAGLVGVTDMEPRPWVPGMPAASIAGAVRRQSRHAAAGSLRRKRVPLRGRWGFCGLFQGGINVQIARTVRPGASPARGMALPRMPLRRTSPTNGDARPFPVSLLPSH